MPDKRGSASQRPKPRFPAQLPGLSSEPYIISQGGAWSIGWCAPVLFTLFHAQPGVDDFEGFVSAMVSEMDTCPRSAPRAVLYHSTNTSQIGAKQRRMLADTLTARREKLKEICTGFVFCTDSGLVRGVVRAVNWLSPPPYPSFEAPTVARGLSLLQSVDSRVDPVRLERCYNRLFSSRLLNTQK